MIYYPEFQDHLAQFSNDELADELVSRGYRVYKDGYAIAGDLSDDEIYTEWDQRGLGRFESIDDACDFIEGQGYYVTNEDEMHHLWEELYGEATTRKTEDFMRWLNNRFIKELNKWL